MWTFKRQAKTLCPKKPLGPLSTILFGGMPLKNLAVDAALNSIIVNSRIVNEIDGRFDFTEIAVAIDSASCTPLLQSASFLLVEKGFSEQ